MSDLEGDPALDAAQYLSVWEISLELVPLQEEIELVPSSIIEESAGIVTPPYLRHTGNSNS